MNVHQMQKLKKNAKINGIILYVEGNKWIGDIPAKFSLDLKLSDGVTK